MRQRTEQKKEMCKKKIHDGEKCTNMQKFIGRVRFVYPFLSLFSRFSLFASLFKSKMHFFPALTRSFHYECFALAYSLHAVFHALRAIFRVWYERSNEDGWNCTTTSLCVVESPRRAGQWLSNLMSSARNEWVEKIVRPTTANCELN